MPDHDWSALVAVSPAIEIAREVASRLRDSRRVREASVRAAQQSQYSSFSGQWYPLSVPHGNAGLAVLCAACDACFPDEGWDLEGRVHLRLAGQFLSERPIGSLGLFGGLCGLAFAAWLLSRHGTRYQRMLAALDEQIVARTLSMTKQMRVQRHGFGSNQYDVISGLAGIGAYLLCRRLYPPAAEALDAVLDVLILLSEAEEGVPHWYTPPERIMQERWQGKFPDGLLDCGLAHGVAGPLALLSLARSAGVVARGLESAIERLAIWLAEHRLDDAWGVNWPATYPAGPLERAQAPLVPSRAAWCYGAPGIARALWLAGEALDRAPYRDLAVQAMEAVYRRPFAVRNIAAPTFCHGMAGLLQITLRFAHDTRLPIFHEAGQALAEQLIGQYEPDSVLGFRDIEQPGDIHVEQPGLLMGAPGAVLVLLATATAQEPMWDRLFLLA
jgi:hypothetical protein